MATSPVLPIQVQSGPTTRPANVLIVCADCAEPTIHYFARHQKVGEYGAYAQVFACKRCSAERRFGLQI